MFTNNIQGTFTTKNGKTISPGFREVVGIKNFRDFVTSPALRGPLVQIVTWNFIFPTGFRAFDIFPGPCHCDHVQ